jgi:hypothetical protein
MFADQEETWVDSKPDYIDVEFFRDSPYHYYVKYSFNENLGSDIRT